MTPPRKSGWLDQRVGGRARASCALASPRARMAAPLCAETRVWPASPRGPRTCGPKALKPQDCELGSSVCLASLAHWFVPCTSLQGPRPRRRNAQAVHWLSKGGGAGQESRPNPSTNGRMPRRPTLFAGLMSAPSHGRRSSRSLLRTIACAPNPQAAPVGMGSSPLGPRQGPLTGPGRTGGSEHLCGRAAHACACFCTWEG